MSNDQNRKPLPYNAKGLRGKLAHVLVDEPTDETDWPADLPPGTKTVIILDDEPNPHHTLRVHPPNDPAHTALVVYDQLALAETPPPKGMDPRRIALNRRHSIEMGQLFTEFLGTHPDVESELHNGQMTEPQEEAWTTYSATLLHRHQSERAALADHLEAEQNQPET
ncbi:hypothetical protein ACFOY4_24540 [Actinomadura syzygii]|uniref:Uncharacterized protein n=1 Tax=Actinomadura syzygii TaxID=1427538 RepID=A0A5D0UKC1_9ACTN|nr:hypothetical protein [Actinomadura syzygii]TYC18407.1 hypothetical protein FXF65_01185 [Actinomadura syzygii]